MKIELQGVHLDKENKLSVTYKLLETENSALVEAGPFTGIVHQDLIDAMSKLNPHTALMTKALLPLNFKSIDEIPAITYGDFTAKSFSESGEGEKLKIVISGNRKEVWGKVFNFNTPAYLVNQSEESESYYVFMPDVKKRVARIKTETLAFLDGSKRGNDPQGNLFAKNGQGSEKNPVGPVTKLIIDEPATKKEWSAGEYIDEIGDEKGVAKFIPNGIKADPVAQQAVKEWDKAEDANRDKRKAVANQAGSKGRGKGGVKRVKQTAENRSGIVQDEETETE